MQNFKFDFLQKEFLEKKPKKKSKVSLILVFHL